MILKEMIFQGHYWMVVLFLGALALIFIGMARIFISMTQGHPVEMDKKRVFREDNSFFRWAIPTLFFILAIGLGVYFPKWLMTFIKVIMKGLGA
jgi:hypothetical protein